ncbi:MAG: ATP-binding cassette domain-containing protein [Alphaproteobacteria bacterium]|jgi:energy-coupling factor transporter ATP-binding protein EcfA2
MAAIIELNGIALTFHGADRPLFTDIDLAVARGEFVTVVGASGAGKSTLLRIVADLLSPSAGRLARNIEMRPDHRVLSLQMANGGAEARGSSESRPLYRLGHVSAVPFVFVSVALGIAESLLAIMTEQIANRNSMGRNLAELQSMQLHIAECAVEVDCARLLMTRDTAEAMAAMRENRPLTMLKRVRNRRDMAYAARLCKSAGNRLHDMAGASGIFDNNITQQKFRDLQAATRHIGLSWDIAGTNCGEVMFGRDPSSPFV